MKNRIDVIAKDAQDEPYSFPIPLFSFACALVITGIVISVGLQVFNDFQSSITAINNTGLNPEIVQLLPFAPLIAIAAIVLAVVLQVTNV